MLGEISQVHKDKYCKISLIMEFEKVFEKEFEKKLREHVGNGWGMVG
jgi:hypothetical protein